MAGCLRQTDFVERASFALGLLFSRWNRSGLQKIVQQAVFLDRFVPQDGIEVDSRTLLGFCVKDHPLRDGKAEHFFQAERLGTELGALPMTASVRSLPRV